MRDGRADYEWRACQAQSSPYRITTGVYHSKFYTIRPASSLPNTTALFARARKKSIRALGSAKSCNIANHNETIKLLTVNAFPEIVRWGEYAQTILLEAAEELDGTYPKKVKVIDRYSQTRSVVKLNARTEVALYELSKGAKCKARVDALLNKEAYIFPGQWTGLQATTWKIDSSEPYGSDAILQVIKETYFKERKSIGYTAIKKYNNNRPNSSAPVLPPSMIALAATAVHVALDEWKNGTLEKASFNGNSWGFVFRRHLKLMKDMKEQSPEGYSAIMGNRYNVVVGDNALPSGEADHSEPSGAAELWDLAKYRKKAD
ncbi:hypothetical protein FA13DRAFT_1777722 [Coprinellus micaceus]|uniref:DUF6532 domain-containing protein n=1 Tax=Coprinellus micaceus TaxID=71717 RepID=A0A4Y7SU85_COPMI|nr:hypothetical protein FA13DRAFT_1777722 [Coprinellus micaceus]